MFRIIIKISLGRRLYHDPRLSGDNSVSCVSCHDLNAGVVDGLNASVGVDGQVGGINAPTVFNSAFNMLQFWDGRAQDLTEQAGGPPLNPIEMASESWEQIIGKLSADSSMQESFKAIYSDGITADNITDAIAEFEKTLIAPNSRFDQYLMGDENVLSEQENQGYKVFVQSECASCHTGEAMGGLSFEHMGYMKIILKIGVIKQMQIRDDLMRPEILMICIA